jgi:hypothetical protein
MPLEGASGAVEEIAPLVKFPTLDEHCPAWLFSALP